MLTSTPSLGPDAACFKLLTLHCFDFAYALQRLLGNDHDVTAHDAMYKI